MGHICAAECTPSPPLGAERVGVRWGTLGASCEAHLTFPPLRVGPLPLPSEGGEGICGACNESLLRDFMILGLSLAAGDEIAAGFDIGGPSRGQQDRRVRLLDERRTRDPVGQGVAVMDRGCARCPVAVRRSVTISTGSPRLA